MLKRHCLRFVEDIERRFGNKSQSHLLAEIDTLKAEVAYLKERIMALMAERDAQSREPEPPAIFNALGRGQKRIGLPIP